MSLAGEVRISRTREVTNGNKKNFIPYNRVHRQISRMAGLRNNNKKAAMACRVFSKNKYGEFHYPERRDFFELKKTTQKDVYKIIFDNDKSVTCSLDQKFLNKRDEPTLLQNLEVGDEVLGILYRRAKRTPEQIGFYQMTEGDYDKEEWRDIEGYNGDYQISNFGRVKSFKSCKEGRLLKQNNRRLRPQLFLCRDGEKKHFRVYQLVMKAFGPEREEHHELIRHLNGNPLDNRIENLAWGTHQENMNDRKILGEASKNRVTPLRIEKIEYVGVKETYDIIFLKEGGNVLVNGFVFVC
ncbi:MAG: hypothetical protein CL489_10710 [Acidobacteria bacterium]|nr:hypothetical protein [Acidobacteriota bacterium]|tara:strand:+ start:892 stop:1782 length:891 start_codon:yes stop_codon:yes gene_type:complete